MELQYNLPIFKKGDRSELKKYIGISLLNVLYKILASIISERLKPPALLAHINAVLCLENRPTTNFSHSDRSLKKPKENRFPLSGYCLQTDDQTITI
uniref:Uncharacterized protein n=1 Tax=Megaselia scalaris TaxID=36166 RepID=T1GPF2_MEGSC